MFLEHEISIYERFLKDHVTLNTGVIAAKNSAVSSQEHYILKNKMKDSFLHCNNISQDFDCILFK